MKTFRDFLFICEKYSEEHAHRKLWNYFISHPKYGKEVRDNILDKNYDKALEIMNSEVEKAKNDNSHPLNFDKAKRGFSVKQGKQEADQKSYYKELDDAVQGVHSLASHKKMRSAVEKRQPSRVTGGSDPNAKLSKTWKSGGGSNKTPKGDLEVYNPKNEKERRGVSMKMGKGAQLASAEPGEMMATYKTAVKSYIQRFHGDKSKEEKDSIRKKMMDQASKASEILASMKTGSAEENTSRKVEAQKIIDKLHDEHPQITRLISQVSTSGDKKFAGKNAPGTAGLVLTGRTEKTPASTKSSEEQKSENPRLALPKGSNRPGNYKIDYRPGQKSNRTQSSFVDFSKKAAQSQQQVAQAQQDLEAANAEAQNASVPIYPDGQPILRQHRKNIEGHMAADPTSPTAQVNNQRRQQAQNIQATAQSNFDNISATHQANVSAAQQQQQSPQKPSTQPQQPTAPSQPQKPSKPQQTQSTQQPPPTKPSQQTQPQSTQTTPPEQQQQQSPQDKTKKKQKPTDTAQRMDAAGQKLGLQ